MTDHSQPVDQHLIVNGFSMLTPPPVKGPGVVELQLDVTHADTAHQWKQSLILTDAQLVKLHDLLEFTIESHS